jgi:hypothetical protein
VLPAVTSAGALLMRLQSVLPGHSVLALMPATSPSATALHSQPWPSAARRTTKPAGHDGTMGTRAGSTLKLAPGPTLRPSPAVGAIEAELHAQQSTAIAAIEFFIRALAYVRIPPAAGIEHGPSSRANVPTQDAVIQPHH